MNRATAGASLSTTRSAGAVSAPRLSANVSHSSEGPDHAHDAVESVYPYRENRWYHVLLVIVAAGVPFAFLGVAVWSLWGTHVTWWHVGMLLVGQLVAGVGITLAHHRMLAHGAFKAPAPVRAVLLWMASLAVEGGPATWAATHQRHHARADREGDPHSPLDGFWHSHFGWMVRGRFVAEGPAFDRLMKDPVVRFFEKTQGWWILAAIVLPGIIAGLVLWSWMAAFTGAVWGGAVRIVLVHHITWSINSVCHVVGTRPYESPDVARNNAVFGVFGFGEGWHNNHHAFPRSAYIGHRWWQVDIGKYLLAVMRPLRLVNGVYVPTREERKAKRQAARQARQSGRSAFMATAGVAQAGGSE